jgi:chromosome segregation and condensation protein ScpB
MEQLAQWPTALGADATPIQDDLKTLWKLRQPSVSQALKDLVQTGCVVALPKQAPGPQRYALTGASRLAFGAANG